MIDGCWALRLVCVAPWPMLKCTILKRVTGEGVPEKSRKEKMTAQGQSDPWSALAGQHREVSGDFKDLGASRQQRQFLSLALLHLLSGCRYEYGVTTQESFGSQMSQSNTAVPNRQDRGQRYVPCLSEIWGCTERNWPKATGQEGDCNWPVSQNSGFWEQSVGHAEVKGSPGGSAGHSWV